MNNNENNINGNELVKNTLDQIPQAKSDAKRITGLVKENGRVTGYQLSDNTIVEKPQAVQMAKQGDPISKSRSKVYNVALFSVTGKLNYTRHSFIVTR